MTTCCTNQTAACCADFYGQDWVRRLAGGCFHPGGKELTLRTVEAMNLEAGSRLLDLGCGTGASALLLAQNKSLDICGIDLGRANIEFAARQAGAGGPAPAKFIAAGAEHLPFASNKFDAILCECTFSLFTDKSAVLSEIKRVLKPGGRLGITDMATSGSLPGDLAALLSPWTCLTDALTADGYRQIFTAAGFTIEQFHDESHTLHELIATVKRNLLLLAAGIAQGKMPGLAFDLASIKRWLDRGKTEIDAGNIRYLRFNMHLPGSA